MKRLLRKEANVSELSVDEITVNSNYLYRSLDNLSAGRFSYSTDQPLLIWKSDDNKNFLIDGYHRLVEGIIFEEKDHFTVQFVEYDDEHKEYIDEYNPEVNDDLNSFSKYKGLEQVYKEEEIEQIKNNFK